EGCAGNHLSEIAADDLRLRHSHRNVATGFGGCLRDQQVWDIGLSNFAKQCRCGRECDSFLSVAGQPVCSHSVDALDEFGVAGDRRGLRAFEPKTVPFDAMKKFFGSRKRADKLCSAGAFAEKFISLGSVEKQVAAVVL